MASTETITISKVEFEQLQEQLKDKTAMVDLLQKQLTELQRLIFGSKTERFIPTHPDQLGLFDFGVDVSTEEVIEKESIIYERNKPAQKKQPVRLELPSHLPRKEEIIEPENLPQDAKRIGQSVTELLEYEPANIYVRKIIRPKYIVSTNDEHTDITIAELPTLPIPKGNAGASMLTQIIISKYVDHLPFYRQRQIFSRQGLDLPESTINGWFSSTCNLIRPLYDVLKSDFINTDYLQADETPISVLTKDKPGATHKGYYWVYYDPIKRRVLFDYQKTRSREGPDKMLKDFVGSLQTDGYKAYNKFEEKLKITLLGCMAHARRKFKQALDNDPERSEYALLLIQKLYEIERYAREQNLNYEQIKLLRQQKSVMILKQFEDWLMSQINQVLPKSAIGQAISYTLTMWPRLKRYVDDGRFNIDNNLIENSIRPVALGRKNYLFAGSHDAADKAAMIYSLLATCKINDIEPFDWFSNMLTVIPGYHVNKLLELIPRS